MHKTSDDMCVYSYVLMLINGSMEGDFKLSRGLRQGDLMSSLFFVICVKYLSTILHRMSELEQF